MSNRKFKIQIPTSLAQTSQPTSSSFILSDNCSENVEADLKPRSD